MGRCGGRRPSCRAPRADRGVPRRGRLRHDAPVPSLTGDAVARACTDPACTGTFMDGFCDTCGRAEPAGGALAPVLSASPASSPSGRGAATGAVHTARQGGYARTTGRVTGARRPSATGATMGTTPGTGAPTGPGTAPGLPLGPPRDRGGARAGPGAPAAAAAGGARWAAGWCRCRWSRRPTRSLLLLADARVPDGQGGLPGLRQPGEPGQAVLLQLRRRVQLQAVA